MVFRVKARQKPCTQNPDIAIAFCRLHAEVEMAVLGCRGIRVIGYDS